MVAFKRCSSCCSWRFSSHSRCRSASSGLCCAQDAGGGRGANGRALSMSLDWGWGSEAAGAEEAAWRTGGVRRRCWI